MATGNLPSYPKGVVGDIARDSTQRPAKLRLRASTTMSHESTVGGNGERKIKRTRSGRR